MKITVLIVSALAVLAGLFVWMKPAAQTVATSAVVPASGLAAPAAVVVTAPTVTSLPQAQTFALVVQNNKLVSGPQLISVAQGTPVTLRLTIDTHDELHLHGYDLSLKLPGGTEPVDLSFIADRSGRFEFELHHSHVGLGALEVQPR